MARGVEKEVEVVGRQREGEKKRKSKGIGKGSVDKELEAKMKEVSVRKTKLLAFINEVSTGYASSSNTVLFLTSAQRLHSPLP